MKKGGLKEICVREEFKIAAKLALDKFRQDEDKKGRKKFYKKIGIIIERKRDTSYILINV